MTSTIVSVPLPAGAPMDWRDDTPTPVTSSTRTSSPIPIDSSKACIGNDLHVKARALQLFWRSYPLMSKTIYL
jgi:hypothetical protein